MTNQLKDQAIEEHNNGNRLYAGFLLICAAGAEINAGQVDLAIEYLHKALDWRGVNSEKNNDSAAAHMLIAELHLKNGDIKKAGRELYIAMTLVGDPELLEEISTRLHALR